MTFNLALHHSGLFPLPLFKISRLESSLNPNIQIKKQELNECTIILLSFVVGLVKVVFGETTFRCKVDVQTFIMIRCGT